MALVFSRRALRDQKMLKDLGYYHGALDGKWGQQSIRAMAAYIANKGKKVTQGSVTRLARTMSRSQHQMAFTRDMNKLDNFWYAQPGMDYTDGDAWSREEYRTKSGRRAHKPNSQHYKRLARDRLMFIHGDYTGRTQDHFIMGKFWESLSPYNRSGCRYSDGNHYERLEYLWGNPFFDLNSKYNRGLTREELEALLPEEYFHL